MRVCILTAPFRICLVGDHKKSLWSSESYLCCHVAPIIRTLTAKPDLNDKIQALFLDNQVFNTRCAEVTKSKVAWRSCLYLSATDALRPQRI